MEEKEKLGRDIAVYLSLSWRSLVFKDPRTEWAANLFTVLQKHMTGLEKVSCIQSITLCCPAAERDRPCEIQCICPMQQEKPKIKKKLSVGCERTAEHRLGRSLPIVLIWIIVNNVCKLTCFTHSSTKPSVR